MSVLIAPLALGLGVGLGLGIPLIAAAFAFTRRGQPWGRQRRMLNNVQHVQVNEVELKDQTNVHEVPNPLHYDDAVENHT